MMLGQGTRLQAQMMSSRAQIFDLLCCRGHSVLSSEECSYPELGRCNRAVWVGFEEDQRSVNGG